MNLQFYMPTKIIMGDDCIVKNAGVLAGMGKKALIVTGSKSAKMNGSLSDVENALVMNGQEYALFDKVMSNPTVDCVYAGAEAAKENKADFIIAIGGGSPMDAAKAISLLSCQDIPREKLFNGEYGAKVLPMAFVPTTAGTGSEVTQYSVLTNDTAKTKTSIATPLLFGDVAFLDSKYMAELSRTTTVNTAVDALSHLLEGYLSVKANAISDTLALSGVEVLAKQFENLKNFTLTPEDRSELLYASTLGGIVIAHTGTTAVHSMGYSLTYFRHVDHGRANGLLIADFMEFLAKTKPERVNMLLKKMGCMTISEFKDILDGLLGKREDVTLEEAESYTSIAVTAKNLQNCIVIPTEKDILDIYKASFNL